MGHAIFLVVHVVALLWFSWALFVTIPAHLIYAAIAGKATPKPNPKTHVRCPDCRELVLKDASVCKHCGCKLIPQP